MTSIDKTSLNERKSLMLSEKSSRMKRIASLAGHGFLFGVTSVAALAVLFIIFFIGRDALPFFQLRGITEIFTSTEWFPSAVEPKFGALPIFFGSALVTLGAITIAVPLGVFASICLSDILPFKMRQVIKPVIEILAAIPSVAFGFFALVVLAPYLQDHGGRALSTGLWLVGTPFLILISFFLSELIAIRFKKEYVLAARLISGGILVAISLMILLRATSAVSKFEIASGTNALNVSLILGLMALPTVVSVAEDSLQAVGRELREGSLALGATKAEMVMRVVMPAASSGIIAAVILGIMRAIGETMVVWMASGNAAQIPTPWYNFLEPVRTLTATIAGDMGEADHVTGSARYHVLFALAFCLLIFSFIGNLVSEWVASRSRVKLEY